MLSPKDLPTATSIPNSSSRLLKNQIILDKKYLLCCIIHVRITTNSMEDYTDERRRY